MAASSVTTEVAPDGRPGVDERTPPRGGDRPRIVILGGGFAGAYCARGLEHRLGDAADVVLIDRHNYFVFYPLLVEAGTGNIEPRHTVVSLRAFLNRTRFIEAAVLGFDPDARTVRARATGRDDAFVLSYDQLVLSLGSTTLLPPIPGLPEHALPMKSLADAVGLRNQAIARLEAAQNEPDRDKRRALLHFVVVGASLTGAEVAGEVDVFLKRATRQPHGYAGREDLRVTLVERSERILGVLDPELSAYADRILRRRGIDVRTGTSVAALERDGVILESGERLEAHTAVWCAGIAPPPLIRELPVPTDELGYVRCRPDLRVDGYDDVWGIGDCANNPDAEGRPAAATAQHAVQQGRHLARNLELALRGRDVVPYRTRTRGTLAALGCRTAVAKVFGIRLSGFWAWWLWRTVYLLKMPGLGRKMRVALDWTINMIFRPEIVHLDVTRQAARRAPPEGVKAGSTASADETSHATVPPEDR